MLSVGDAAPDFRAVDCLGRPVQLSSFRGNKQVVLFFFPRAFSVACTEEVRHFRDHQERIEQLGAVLIGVSLDSVVRQCDFARSENIDFALLGDEGGHISKSYGVVWPVLKIDRRATFIIDREGVIRHVIHHEVRVHRHLDDVLAALHHALDGHPVRESFQHSM